jgi:hypothetical protein
MQHQSVALKFPINSDALANALSAQTLGMAGREVEVHSTAGSDSAARRYFATGTCC